VEKHFHAHTWNKVEIQKKRRKKIEIYYLFSPFPASFNPRPSLSVCVVKSYFICRKTYLLKLFPKHTNEKRDRTQGGKKLFAKQICKIDFHPSQHICQSASRNKTNKRFFFAEANYCVFVHERNEKCLLNYFWRKKVFLSSIPSRQSHDYLAKAFFSWQFQQLLTLGGRASTLCGWMNMFGRQTTTFFVGVQ
jgi:hypothetical protein